ELAFALLACARIGAIHSVVFGGFSADSLAQRIVDCESDVMITTDAGIRGGRTIPLKSIADDAIGIAAKKGVNVRCVLVNHRAGDGVGTGSSGWVEGRDFDMDAGMANAATECEPEIMDAEDPLFILYTSGSTGQPKGVMHSQAGYMIWTATTCKYVFDLDPERDLHFCTADIGWITGHSYIVYGPLALGTHTLMFEGIPTYPDAGRFWDICDKHKPTTFYTAPTAIRALMVYGDDPVTRYKRSSIRVLGTVGEPINPEAWMWYHEVVGDSTRPIVDTWWQTETGGIMITPLPGMTTTKPGSATYPFFGINPKIVHADGEECNENEGGYLIIEGAWPGMMRTIYGDHDRFVKTYFSQQPGRYFTGDGARKDEDGCFWIMGRIDDVINVSGHRMGTAEVESALVEHEAVCEAAVVGFPHDIKGQGIYCFVTLEGERTPSEDLRQELRAGVRQIIGPIATPDKVHFTQVLPKTRSGKIMRRILRKIASGDISDMGDTSTLADPSVVPKLLDSRPE
nr:acetate--CoA ligase [Candidatus Poseidoniales archaeon]